MIRVIAIPDFVCANFRELRATCDAGDEPKPGTTNASRDGTPFQRRDFEESNAMVDRILQLRSIIAE